MRRIGRLQSPGTLLIALVVVIVASAGTATAAKLITSGQIKNGTIKRADLNKSVRNQLDNDYLAKVSETGALVAGKGATSAQRSSVGDFQVTFAKSVDRCAPTASVRGTAQNEFYGFVTTYTPGGNTVRVVIRNPAGAKADGGGFNLVVEC